jgi:hypothetical protein
MHLTDDQLFEMLCQARDRLEAGPADGPERSELHMDYLRATSQAFKRACVWQHDPLPRMNRRFLVLNLQWCLHAAFIETLVQTPYYFDGYGRGWTEVRGLPPPRYYVYRPEDPDPDLKEQDDEILWSHQPRCSPILSSKMLAIWRRLDAAALDILPVRLAPRAGAPADRDYWAVDVTRVLPAFDEARMRLRRFRRAAPYTELRYFPKVEAVALREDLPVSGVHLFRDEIDRERIFISVELARECYAAGAGSVFTIFDWPDRPNYGVGLKDLLVER